MAEAGAASEPVFFPRRVEHVTVKVIPGGGGSAVVQFTLDDPKAVAEDPSSADWSDWEPGSVSDPTTQALTGPVMALRVVASDAAAVMQVVGDIDY